MDNVIPIEIRPGMYVHIGGLPLDLTQAEADKITAVVMALATQPGEEPAR